MNKTLLLSLPLLATLAVAIGSSVEPVPPAPADLAAAESPPPPAPQPLAPAAVTPARHRAAAASLAMPDGSLLAPLNGAIDPPPPRWQRGRPYAPVTGIVRLADGRDSYVHADGSRTTTFMTWRGDLGRSVAVTSVTSPMPVQPALSEQAPGR